MSPYQFPKGTVIIGSSLFICSHTHCFQYYYTLDYVKDYSVFCSQLKGKYVFTSADYSQNTESVC